ncbi:MAG: TolB family protein, partial [Dehalococcoidia bacterium]
YISGGNVWLLAASVPRQLTSDRTYTSVRWTPGGAFLLAHSAEGDVLLGRDGAVGPALVGAWTPNDSTVAVAMPDGGVDLVSPASRDAEVLIAAAPSVVFEPVAWSPDGAWLALVRSISGPKGLPVAQAAWLVRRDGSELHELVPAGDTWPRPLSWSPDGDWLAVYRGPAEPCASCRADGQRLDVVAVDGSRVLTVGNVLRPDWISWSPDSTWLVAAVGSGRESYRNKRLLRIDLPVGTLTELAGGAYQAATQPAVSPDGAQIALVLAPALVGDAFSNLDAAHGYPALIADRRIGIVNSPGAAPALLDTPAGSAGDAPQWVGAGLLLFVRWQSTEVKTSSRELWLADLNAGSQTRLASELGERGSAVGFYGELGWSSLFSWHP